MDAPAPVKCADVVGSAVPAQATSLKVGALLNWASLGVSILTAFVVTPIIIHRLGNAGFGMWALIQSFSGYYGLVNLGLGSALMRSITRDLAVGSLDSLQVTVSTAHGFFAVTGGLILVAAGFLGLPAAGFFHVAPPETVLFALTIFVAASAVVVDFFGAVASSFLNAGERFAWLNAVNIGRQLAQTLGTLAVLWSAPSVLGIALVILGTSVLSLVVCWRLAAKVAPSIRVLGGKFSFVRLKELLSYGGSTVLLTISNLVRLRLGNLVIARFSGMGSVAAYSIAVSLITNYSQVLSSAMGVLNPRFTRLDAQARTEELGRLYRMSLFVSSGIAFGMGALMFVFGESFVQLWLRKEMPEAVLVLKILVVAFALALAQSPGWNLMFATSKHHFMARLSVVEAIVNVLVGLWWSKVYGPVGFAWATAVVMTVTKLFIQPVYAARIGGLRLMEYLSPMAIPLLCAVALVAAAMVGGLEALLRTHGLGAFVLCAVVFGGAYVAALLGICRRKDYMPVFVEKLLGRVW